MLTVTLADVTDLEYHGQILASGITPITDLHTQAPGVSDKIRMYPGIPGTGTVQYRGIRRYPVTAPDNLRP